jgi:hypothetical protein
MYAARRPRRVDQESQELRRPKISIWRFSDWLLGNLFLWSTGCRTSDEKNVDALLGFSIALVRGAQNFGGEKWSSCRYDGVLDEGRITKRTLGLIALICGPYLRQWTLFLRSASVHAPIAAGGLTQRWPASSPITFQWGSRGRSGALAIRQSHELLRSHRSHASWPHERKSKRPRDAVRLRTIEISANG